MKFLELNRLALNGENYLLFKKDSIKIPQVSIIHYGGTCVTSDSSDELHSRLMRTELMRTIGLGSVLTCGNPNMRELKEFAEIALESKELWALRTYYVTMMFYDIPRCFRDAVAYSRRFHLQWSVRNMDWIYFSAQANAYDWWKFLCHKDDLSFPKKHRVIMTTAWEIWSKMLPELFKPIDGGE